MELHRLTARLVAYLSALVVTGGFIVSAAPATADEPKLGTQSLAEVLAADGAGFDTKRADFDILDNAVQAVLAAKPRSAVAALASGETRLTAFVPTDRAFRRLVHDLTGKQYASEQQVFNRLAAVAGIDTIESVLLYHVVPGAVVTNKDARAADGARLATALDGATVGVRVHGDGRVFLVDNDYDDRNARLLWRLKDLNAGNRQIAHGVNRVLRPIDL